MTQISYEEFAEQHGLEIAWSKVDSNPDMDDPAWKADHYLVTITGAGLPTTLHFSKGGQRDEPPVIEEVLESLAMTARSCREADDFAEWAESLGMDSDSIKALKSYQASMRITNDLERTVGSEAMEQFLWNTTDSYSLGPDDEDDLEDGASPSL